MPRPSFSSVEHPSEPQPKSREEKIQIIWNLIQNIPKDVPVGRRGSAEIAISMIKELGMKPEDFDTTKEELVKAAI